jgi:hypothetical protein
MIVKILQGVPFLVDAATKTIYAYEKVPSGTPLRLGTYNPETETFELRSDWKEAYAPKLADHREQEKPRSRVATGGK